ncbi:MAG TPA: MFS transporter [Polyangiaceae bacterium]|jgi:MFS family permease
MIKRPAFIVAILTAINLFNYMDRTVLAAVLPSLQADPKLRFDDFHAGALATAFLIGYFATSPSFGALADASPRLRTRLMALGVFVWSVATVLTGHATGFWSMLGARALVGVGEASYAVIAPTLIDDLAPQKSKSRLLAIFYLAIPVGSALGYVLGGFLEKHFGWHRAFNFAGGPGAVLALLCLFVDDRGARAARKTATRLLDFIAPWARALPMVRGNGLYARTVLGYCAQTFALGGFSYWAPKYIHARYGVELEHANFVFGALLVVAGLMGTGIGGFWGDFAARGLGREDAARVQLRICGITGLAAAPLAAATVLAPGPRTFFTFIFWCEIAIFISTSPLNAAILQSVGTASRASAMALSIFAIHLLGDLWSPPLVGAISDRSSMRVGMLLLPVAVLVSGVVWIGNKSPSTSVPSRRATENRQ